MRIWMDVMRDLEHLIEAPEPIFDAWKAGGVDGLVIGPLVFHAGKLAIGHDRGRSITPSPGTPAPTLTFDPDPAVYERFGVPTPGAPEAMPEARDRLANTFRAAKERGLSVWIFQAQTGAGGGGGGHHLHDGTGIAATCARIVDTLEHYPEADGAVMDGPEWGYEIAPPPHGRPLVDLQGPSRGRAADVRGPRVRLRGAVRRPGPPPRAAPRPRPPPGRPPRPGRLPRRLPPSRGRPRPGGLDELPARLPDPLLPPRRRRRPRGGPPAR